VMCTSGKSHSLPAVVAGRLGRAERQLRHIVLAGLRRRLDVLLSHSNWLLGFTTVPVTLSVAGRTAGPASGD